MTRKKAIDFGNIWLEINKDAKESYTYEFFKTAVKALEQKSETGWIPVNENTQNEVIFLN